MRVASASLRHLRYIMIHKDKVTETPAHDKKMEDLMGSEEGVSAVKQWELQRVDHTAYCINDPACQKPEKSIVGQCIP